MASSETTPLTGGASAGTPSASTTNAVVPVKPPAPHFGTVEETYPGSNVYYYAFGGAPKWDWTGIQDPKLRLLSDPCYRSLDPVQGQKTAHHRTKSLAKKFENSMKLSDFGTKVMEHLREYGLDTLAYLPDPRNPTKVLSVVDYHARFTGDMEKSLKSCADCKLTYDSWDKKHDHDAKKFLFNSLSDITIEKFKPFHNDDDSFAATWLKLVQHLVTTTSKTFDGKKEQIRSLKPQHFAGQNIETMSTKYIELADEISNAGYYSHGLTLNMVDGFLQATKDPAGTFHHQINVLREKVRKMEQDTIFMNQLDQADSFAKAHLSYNDICVEAIKSYHELLADNKWEPAKLPKDRQAPAKDFGVNLTKSEVLNLIHQTNAKGGNYGNDKSDKRPCFNCGATDHFSLDCPKPRKTPEQNKARRHKEMAKWKMIAPSDGESQTKEVNGRKFYWCTKCGNWSTTHGTSGHTGKSPHKVKGNKKSGKGAQTNLASWEPAAWIIEADITSPTKPSTQPTTTSLLFMTLLYTIFSIAFTTLINTWSSRQHDKIKATCSNKSKEGKYNDKYFCHNLQPRRKPPAVKQKTHYKPQGIPNHLYVPDFRLTVPQCSRAKIALSKQRVEAKLANSNPTVFVTRASAAKVAQLSPSILNTSIQADSKCKSFPVIWDTGASVCVSPDKNDFISYNEPSNICQVKGLGGKKSQVAGEGFVLWSIHDVNGQLRQFKLPACHIPDCKSRLISTNVLLNTYQSEYLTVDATGLELSGFQGDQTRSPVLVHNNPATNLPTATAYCYNVLQDQSEFLCNTVSTVDSHNQNLNESQKELLRWHQRLGHLAFKKIQHLMRTGVLSHTEGTRQLHTAASKIVQAPKCAACLFGKQTVRSSPGSTTSVVKDRSGVLCSGNLLPGMEVSVDHFISSIKGRLFSGYDKGGDDTRFVGGCIFIDHASSYIHVECQTSLSTHETLRAKLAFERHCRDYGIVVQKYMSDNGKAFTSQDFSNHLTAFDQVSKLAGVGAHHHNALAERAIRTIMSISRATMIHAGIHWPDMAKASLWPMAVAQSCYIYNHVPDPSTGLSPADIFTKTRWPHKRFHDLHVWGCPTYVLDKALQDGKKLPKWKPRSDRCVYMGVSAMHASSVPLVLNPSTGSITPQFHVVFDDWFSTVANSPESLPNFASDEWNKLFGDSTFQYVLDEEPNDTNESDLLDAIKTDERTTDIASNQEYKLPPIPLPLPPPPELKIDQSTRNQQILIDPSPSAPEPQTKVVPPLAEEPSYLLPEVPDYSMPTDEPNPTGDHSPVRKNSSRRQQVRFEERSLSSRPRRSTNPPEQQSHSSRPRRHTVPIERLSYTHDKSSLTGKTSANVTLVDTYDLGIAPFQCDAQVLKASKGDNPDLFSYEEAMAGEHREEWIKAARREIESLESLKCWEEIPFSKATTKVLPGTWVFKVKRAPDGTFKKFKARYCIRGDLQEGDFDTYAPVVSFSSVRLFLAWSLILGWVTCTVDFSNAFIQADLKDPTFIHLPRGFQSSSNSHSERTCLRLKKSIYGLSVAPRLWFQHLLAALKEEGLVQSKHDACLMFRKDLIIIQYVDDLGIQAPNEGVINTLISSLRKKGFELTLEGSFTEYLGIQYEQCKDGSIHMTQSGLIQKLLNAAGMTECNPNRTPTTREALGSDPEGKPMEDSWNYRSIIGMLLYLTTNTRPDIAFAVSQVARFSHNPKNSHASAVKTILRYLAGTKDKGVIYKRPKKLVLDCFVDADYAGLYGREPSDSPLSAKSRSGYIISIGDCYLLCKSQLQSTIALSTSEAEYGALSQSLRVLLPIRNTILELIEIVDVIDAQGSSPFGSKSELRTFETLVHEDNTTALSLALKQKVTSRTKHWCVKFHFFWDHINDKKNNIKCVKVHTKEQRADYLTKGLTKDLFEHCRMLNQGW